MLYIFDLDDCLIHEGFEDVPGEFVFEHTHAVLTELQEQGHTLAIASHNTQAQELLSKNGIAHYFRRELVQGFEHTSKVAHISAILRLAEFDVQDCVYFDDVQKHVLEAQQMGLHAELCCHLKGLNPAQILRRSASGWQGSGK